MYMILQRFRNELYNIPNVLRHKYAKNPYSRESIYVGFTIFRLAFRLNAEFQTSRVMNAAAGFPHIRWTINLKNRRSYTHVYRYAVRRVSLK